MKALLLVLAGTVIVIVVIVAVGSGPNIDCAKVSPDIRKVIDYWTTRGVIIDTREEYVIVEDVKWSLIPNDSKVSIAVAYFCKVHPDGLGSVFVRGYRDGQRRALVSDGHYSD